MKVLDLCAGTGSATAAFRDRGHEVITLDIAGEADIRCDVREWYPRSRYFNFIWASPPCDKFSIATGIPYKDRNPDLSIVKACHRIIKKIKPRYWIIENPRGALRYFIGKPTITIKYSDYGHVCQKPTDLWGEFPWFYPHTPPNNNPIPIDYAFPNHNSQGKLERAKIPYNLSLAICLALEGELES